jgi:integrase
VEAAPNTVSQELAALRFFYIQVLKRTWSIAETPYPKRILHLPQVLRQEEVGRLIDAAEIPFDRILLMTLYATGARRAEVAKLKISDIDSQRMVIHIQGGKGRKDRDVMLSPTLLDALRTYWRGLRYRPTYSAVSKSHSNLIAGGFLQGSCISSPATAHRIDGVFPSGA